VTRNTRKKFEEKKKQFLSSEKLFELVSPFGTSLCKSPWADFIKLCAHSVWKKNRHLFSPMFFYFEIVPNFACLTAKFGQTLFAVSSICAKKKSHPECAKKPRVYVDEIYP